MLRKDFGWRIGEAELRGMVDAFIESESKKGKGGRYVVLPPMPDVRSDAVGSKKPPTPLPEGFEEI